MEVTVLTHCEQVTEAALLHFQDRVLDGRKLGIDVLIVGREVRKGSQDLNSFVFPLLQNQPSGALR